MVLTAGFTTTLISTVTQSISWPDVCYFQKIKKKLTQPCTQVTYLVCVEQQEKTLGYYAPTSVTKPLMSF